jgi:hypothetical protein
MNKQDESIQGQSILVRVMDKNAIEAKKQENYSVYLSKYENFMKSYNKKQRLLDHVPAGIKFLFLKIVSGEVRSPSNAIKLKCLDCCVWSREEAKLCETIECALWHYRPYQEKKEENQGEEEE